MRQAVVVSILAGIAGSSSAPQVQEDSGWTDTFVVAVDELGPTGVNPYLSLQPGYQQVLEHGAERLTITVLPETRIIDGVETRVVEERETDGGALREVSRNFLAISARTNAVFYFGEEVDIYRDGAIASHEGAWRAGSAGARFGLLMSGLPLLGSRYYQEVAPGVALDRARIVALADTLTIDGRSYHDVLRIEETTPLERGAREFKYYAPGVGLLRDGELTLVWAGPRPTRKDVHE